jgi:hypothetical protein
LLIEALRIVPGNNSPFPSLSAHPRLGIKAGYWRWPRREVVGNLFMLVMRMSLWLAQADRTPACIGLQFTDTFSF